MPKFQKTLSSSQMTLDFGQKEFGTRVCKDCNMVYTIGDANDLKAHKKFHAQYMSQEIKVSYFINNS